MAFPCTSAAMPPLTGSHCDTQLTPFSLTERHFLTQRRSVQRQRDRPSIHNIYSMSFQSTHGSSNTDTRPPTAAPRRCFASVRINHPHAVTRGRDVSIMVHHLRPGEMKVIHSKMDHSRPACHMLFRVRRRSTVEFWVIFQVSVSLKFGNVESYTSIRNL